jgi:hypothetical protein
MDQTALIWLVGVIGYFGGIVSSILTHVLGKMWDEHVNKTSKKLHGRADLKADICLFCDKWRDREVITRVIPTFRKELIEDTINIRQNVRQYFTGLSDEKIAEILDLSNAFLELAARSPEKDDISWLTEHAGEIESVFKRFNCLKI